MEGLEVLLASVSDWCRLLYQVWPLDFWYFGNEAFRWSHWGCSAMLHTASFDRAICIAHVHWAILKGAALLLVQESRLFEHRILIKVRILILFVEVLRHCPKVLLVLDILSSFELAFSSWPTKGAPLSAHTATVMQTPRPYWTLLIRHLQAILPRLLLLEVERCCSNLGIRQISRSNLRPLCYLIRLHIGIPLLLNWRIEPSWRQLHSELTIFIIARCNWLIQLAYTNSWWLQPQLVIT